MGHMAILAAGATVVSMAGSIMQGRAAAGAAAFEQQQLKEEERMARIRADQEEAERRKELVATQATISAIRASRGLVADSPTGQVLERVVDEESELDRRAETLSNLSLADRYRLGATMAGRRKRNAMLSGFVEAAGTGLRGGMRISQRDAGIGTPSRDGWR